MGPSQATRPPNQSIKQCLGCSPRGLSRSRKTTSNDHHPIPIHHRRSPLCYRRRSLQRCCYSQAALYRRAPGAILQRRWNYPDILGNCDPSCRIRLPAALDLDLVSLPLRLLLFRQVQETQGTSTRNREVGDLLRGSARHSPVEYFQRYTPMNAQKFGAPRKE